MLTDPAAAPLVGALGLFERAIGYTRASLQLVTRDRMGSATPCARWNLRELLHHMNDSLAALQEAADVGYVDIGPDRGCGDGHDLPDVVATLRTRACTLLGAWTTAGAAAPVSVAGRPLPVSILASTGALEVTVHGWDVARACGHAHPLPPQLAGELLDLVSLLVTDHDRPARFAARVPVSPLAPAGDRLLAFLGRHP